MQQSRVPHPSDWRPNPGPQTRFLSLTCREALYGGAAGGGKSVSLLVDAIRYVGRGYGSAYKALLLRRTFPELEKSLIPESQELYPRLGGRYNRQSKVWTFPAGETVWFGHMVQESDRFKYQSDEFQFVGFDELTHFTEKQYLYVGFSRMRSSKGIPLRLRAGTNPGSDGHEWVFKRFGPWLDPQCDVHAEPGSVLYFRQEGDSERLASKGEPGAFGRCFVPAKVGDNPYISPQYREELNQLDAVTRAQLGDGDWLIKPGRGIMFQRAWFDTVDDFAPDDAPRVRYWDLAGSEDDDSAYTVGVLMAKTDYGFVVENVKRFRGTPGTVEQTILKTAGEDPENTTIGLPQDPGQAGIAQVVSYQKLLQGFSVRFERETGDKITRAKPFSAQTEPPTGKGRGRVALVRGDWNLAYVQELEAFPDQKLKDQVDASSGAFAMLTQVQRYSRGGHGRSSRVDGSIRGQRR